MGWGLVCVALPRVTPVQWRTVPETQVDSGRKRNRQRSVGSSGLHLCKRLLLPHLLCLNSTSVFMGPIKRCVDGRGKPADELLSRWRDIELEALPESGVGSLLHKAGALITPAEDVSANCCRAAPLDMFRSFALLHAWLLRGLDQQQKAREVHIWVNLRTHLFYDDLEGFQ